MKKMIIFFNPINISKYIKRRRTIERIKERKIEFEFQKTKILTMLLDNKETKDSISLFEAVQKEYLETFEQKYVRIKQEKILIHNHLSRNHKI